MANYYSGTLQKGSQGDEVKKWQEYLNTQGYGLSVDGDFGDKTYNATIDYQTKNGLGADGIVGEKTWGKAGYTLSPSTQTFAYDDFKYKDYNESDSASVTAAGENKTKADDAVKNYGDFSYSNDETFKGIIDKILNREKFSYDFNGDALYQQYKDKYIQQGKMAMQDTMGQAAAMTGGYGNSYAASVGNQAYQASLQNLNDVIPELYQMAYDKYNQEGQDLYNQYGMLSDDRNTQYAMYNDKYNKLVADRDYYADAYNTERNYDYNKYMDGRDFEYDKYSTDKSYAYQQHRDAIADEQWNKTFDEGVRQFNASQTESARQHDNTTNVRREEIGNKDNGGGSDLTYVANDTTTNWKNLLPTTDEFRRNDSGYEYNGIKYKDWEAFIDAKLSDAIDNGDLTESEAYSIMVDLGLV